MRIEGSCLSGGPLSMGHIPIPVGTVTHAPRVHVTPKPLQAYKNRPVTPAPPTRPNQEKP